MLYIFYFSAVICNEADKMCYCDKKVVTACSGVTHSSCDEQSGSCQCLQGYYNNNGVCTPAPGNQFITN